MRAAHHPLVVSLAMLASAGCGGSGPPAEAVHAQPDPAVDPARDPHAPFRPGEQVDLGQADAIARYDQYNAWAEEAAIPGDLDGDGLDDLLIIGHVIDPPDTVECSHGCPGFERAFIDVVYGSTSLGTTRALAGSARLTTWHVHSLRFRVRTAGDLDRDGRADFLVGAWTSGCEQGNAFSVYGGSRLAGEEDVRTRGALLRERGSCTHFGVVSGLGDIDGDGYDDFAVGAPAAAGGAGRLYVYYGGAARPAARLSELDASATLTDDAGTFFAWAQPVGDVDGDGADDFLAHGRAEEHGTPARPWLVMGSARRLTGEVDVATRALRIDAPLTSAAPLGDVDHDGLADFALAAATRDVRDAFIIPGRRGRSGTLGLDAAVSAVRRERPAEVAVFVAGAGDVDGDGHPDLLYGDPGYGGTPSARGSVWLFRGGPTGFASELPLAGATAFLGQLWFSDDGAARGGDAAGSSIAAGGDVNGDGLDDLAFVAPGAPQGGRVYLWLGRR